MPRIDAVRYKVRGADGRDLILYDATGPDGQRFEAVPHIAQLRVILRQRYGPVTVGVSDSEATRRIAALNAAELAERVEVRAAESAGELRSAGDAGRCDCCMTKYGPGERLSLETYHGRRYWVLVIHPPFKFKELGT